MAKPPFAGQWGHDSRMAALKSLIDLELKGMHADAAKLTETEYLENLRAFPNDPYLWKSYAYFLQSSRRIAEAVRAWRRVEALWPENFLVSFQIGKHLLELNQYAEARDQLERAVRLRPHEAVAQVVLARCLMSESSDERAITILRRVIANQPDVAEAHEALGDALVRGEQFAAAISSFEQAVKLKPERVRARLNLCAMYVRQGRLAEGRQQAVAALQIDPQNRVASDYLRRIEERMK